jgi:hypothetical protein
MLPPSTGLNASVYDAENDIGQHSPKVTRTVTDKSLVVDKKDLSP